MSEPRREPRATTRPSAPGRIWAARLSLFAFAGLGVLLWRDGRYFPREREVYWQTPADRASLVSVEIQILGPEGDLLKREQFFFKDGAPPLLSQKLALKNGTYRAMVFLQRAGGSRQQLTEKRLRISGDGTFTFPLVGSEVTLTPTRVH